MARQRDHRSQAGPVEVDHIPVSELTEVWPTLPGQLLGLIRHGAPVQEHLPVDCPVVPVPIPAIDGQNLVEVWRSSTPVVIGKCHGVHFAMNGQALFGVHQLEDVGTPLDELAYAAYSDIVRLVTGEHYPHLLRMWNYFGAPNRDQGGLERYRRFCVGRYHAFADLKPELEMMLPAASVIGSKQAGLIVYFLAAREAGMPVENPRQVSAYRYPRRYSPRSPSFSRAMVKNWGTRDHLYVSGTASIVGHQTRHPSDVRKQLEEIMRNLDAVLKEAHHVTGMNFRDAPGKRLFKFYIRHAEDLLAVRESVASALGEELPILYLRGDLCRKDLLVEVEAVYACEPVFGRK